MSFLISLSTILQIHATYSLVPAHFDCGKDITIENAAFKLTDSIMNAVNTTGIFCYLAQNFHGGNIKSF
jgi:hypothetical protein